MGRGKGMKRKRQYNKGGYGGMGRGVAKDMEEDYVFKRRKNISPSSFQKVETV